MSPEYDGRITACHKKLHNILEELGFQVRDNFECDSYRLDCYVPEINMAMEADGKFFHGFKKRDRERDSYIYDKFGIKILRITEDLLNGKHDNEVKDLILRFIDVNNT